MRIGVDIDGVLNDIGEWHYSCGFKFCIENNIDRGFNPYKYMMEEQFNLTVLFKKTYRNVAGVRVLPSQALRRKPSLQNTKSGVEDK